MTALVVGAGDTVEPLEDGLVKCAECLKARRSGVGRLYCKVFSMPMPADEKRLCTAWLPVGQV